MNHVLIFSYLLLTIIYKIRTEEHFARIISGYRPKKFIFAKHIVSLRYGSDGGIYGSNHICCGSIISRKAILTAAHCVINTKPRGLKNINDMTVVAGNTDRLNPSDDEQVFRVSEMVPFSQFDFKTGYGDIAIVKLARTIIENDINVQRIPLGFYTPVDGERCIALGWGSVVYNGPLADVLVYMNATMLPFWICSLLANVTKGTFCVGEISPPTPIAGSGDSGGPLICNGTVVGVASHVLLIQTFYSSVKYYQNWISANMQNDSPKHFICLQTLITCLIYLEI